MNRPAGLFCAVALVGGAWALAPPPVQGQGLQRQADPEAVMVDELVVRARAPGPAWWRVSNGSSTVWILGVPASLPKGTAWDDGPLRARLQLAKALILPGQVRLGPFQALFFFLKHRKALRSSTPLEQSLPGPLAQRFATVRQGLGQDAKKYASWKPAVAGVILGADFRRAARVETDEPEHHIRALAAKAHVPAQPAARYDGGEVLNAVIDMSDQAQIDCLGDAVAEVEAGKDRVYAAARGWSGGDVREALTLERGYDRCFDALPSVSALLRRGQADIAGAITQALAKPGDAIAMVELRALLARGGVLDRLRAQGYAVSAPDRT